MANSFWDKLKQVSAKVAASDEVKNYAQRLGALGSSLSNSLSEIAKTNVSLRNKDYDAQFTPEYFDSDPEKYGRLVDLDYKTASMEDLISSADTLWKIQAGENYRSKRNGTRQYILGMVNPKAEDRSYDDIAKESEPEAYARNTSYNRNSSDDSESILNQFKTRATEEEYRAGLDVLKANYESAGDGDYKDRLGRAIEDLEEYGRNNFSGYMQEEQDKLRQDMRGVAYKMDRIKNDSASYVQQDFMSFIDPVVQDRIAFLNGGSYDFSNLTPEAQEEYNKYAAQFEAQRSYTPEAQEKISDLYDLKSDLNKQYAAGEEKLATQKEWEGYAQILRSFEEMDDAAQREELDAAIAAVDPFVGYSEVRSENYAGNVEYTAQGNKATLDQIIAHPEQVIEEVQKWGSVVSADEAAALNAWLAQLMTDDERSAYFKIRDTMGEEAAANYFDQLTQNRLWARDNAIVVAEAEELANSGFFGGVAASAMSVFTKPIATIAGMSAYIRGEENANSPAFQMSTYGNTMRETVGQNIAEAVPMEGITNAIGFNPLQVAYSGAMYGIDSVLSLAMTGNPAAAGLMQAASATSEGYKSGIERGLDKTTARILSAGEGAIEYLTEKIPLDKLMKTQPADTLFKFIGNILKQGATESGEEAIATIANTGWEYALMEGIGDDSELTERYEDLTQNGYSSEGALWKIARDKLSELGADAFAGFASGAGMGAGATAIQTAEQGAIDKQTGKQIVEHGNAEAIIRAAEQYKGKNKGISALGKKLRAKLQSSESGTLPDDAETRAEMSVLQEEMDAEGVKPEAEEVKPEVKEETKPEDTKANNEAISKYIGSEKKLGKLYRKLVSALEIDLSETNKQELRQAIKTRLEQLGEEASPAVADAIAAAVEGNISEKQNDILEAAAYSKPVINELLGSLVRNHSDWTSRITSAETMRKEANLSSLRKATREKISLDETDAEEPEIKVSDSGTATVTDAAGTHSEAELVGIADAVDGVLQAVVKVDGKEQTVPITQVQAASEEQATLISRASQIGDTEAANKMISMYDGGDAAAFADAFTAAYEYGTTGGSYTLEQAQASARTTGLSREQIKAAYDLGKAREAAEASQSVPFRSSTKGRLTIDDRAWRKVSAMNAKEKAAAYANIHGLRALANVAGINIEVFESEADAEGKYTSENGSFNRATNTMRIDINAGKNSKASTAANAMLRVAGHELTHYIRANNAAGYQALQDFVVPLLTKREGVSFDTLVANKQNAHARMFGSELAYADAVEEVVADASEMMLKDSTAIQQLAQKDKSLFKRIRNWIRNFTNAVKRAFQGVYANSEEAKAMIDSMDELQKIWDDAFIKAVENTKAAGNAGISENITETAGIVEGEESAYVDPDMLRNSLRSLAESDYVRERDKAAAALAKKLGVTKERAQAYIDDMMSIAAIVAADRERLDFEAEDEYASIKKNSEYKWTVDFSTLCKKRLLYTGTFDAIQRRLGKTALNEDDYIRLRSMMAERGYEVACAFCYVESRRKKNGEIIQKFLDIYTEAQKNGKPMMLGATGRQEAFNTEDGFIPTIADFNTTTGYTNIIRNHPEIYKAYMKFMNARGVSKPKLIESRTDYRNEILQKFKSPASVKAMIRRGGLRLQSFSDFETVNMLDMMQLVTDMARVGLTSQAYTKVPNFAEVFGGTGVKINLSLVAKGVDKNGKLIFDDVEGMPHKEAFRLREMYSKNVGTILVAGDDATIYAAMKDPKIDFIIPYHRSGWSTQNEQSLGIGGYQDYSMYQNEVSAATGRSVKNKQPSEYWDFNKTGDENAQTYLEMCRNEGRIPKFPQFQGMPGYWKMLIDFKMYDNNGVGSPQIPVSPDFNMEAARRILSDYEGGHENLPVARDVVEDFVKEKQSERYSLRETVDGRKVVAVENDILHGIYDGGKWTKEQKTEAKKAAKNALKSAGPIYSGGIPIYINADTREEFPSSRYVRETLGKKKQKLADRFRIASEAEDMLVATVNWENDPLEKPRKDYVRFVKGSVYMSIHGRNYEAVVKVGEKTNGGYVLYDLVDMVNSSFELKKEDNSSAAQAQSAIAPYLESSSSEDIVAPSEPGVKGKFQLRDPYNLTDRDMLVGALETAAASDAERNALGRYRGKIAELYELEEKLAPKKEEISAIYRSRGTRDMANLNKLKAEAADLEEKISKVDKQLLNLESTAAMKSLLEREKARLNRKASAEKKTALSRARERRDATELRHKIRAVLDDFNRRLKNPTEKRYIPVNFVGAVIAAGELIDTDSKRGGEKAAAKIAQIRGLYEQYKSDPLFNYAYDEVVAGMLDNLQQIAGNKSIYQLGRDELQAVYDVVKALKKQVTEAIQLKSGEYNRNIIEVGREMALDIIAAEPIFKNEKISDLLNWHLSPNRFFARLGGYKKGSAWTNVVADSFNRGTETMYEIQRDFYNHFREFSENKQFDSLTSRKKLVDIGLKDKAGQKVEVTRGMMLSIYMHLLNEDNRRGIMYGGLTIPNLAKYYNGKMGDAYGRGSGMTIGTASELYQIAKKLREADLTDAQREELEARYDASIRAGEERLDRMKSAIEKQLTDFEKRLIKAAQEWNDGKSQKYINDVTMDLYGIKKANVKNYWRIHRDTSFIQTDFDSISKNVNLENWGSLKARVPSQAPVLLTDFAFEMDGNMQQMSRYVGYARAQRDFKKLYNVRLPGMDGSVKKAVASKFGTGKKAAGVTGEQYIENFIGDITGSRSGETAFWGAVRRNIPRAALALNIRVAASQLSAIPTAAAEVGWGNMAKGAAKGFKYLRKSELERISQENIWFWQRYRGDGGMREFADMKGGGNIIDKGYNWIADTKLGDWLLNWCQKADVASTVGMYAMAEEWVKKNTNHAPGTEAFKKAVNDKYSLILRNTQPNYTATEAADVLRDKRESVKMFTMFKTQSYQNFNMLYDAMANLRKTARDLKNGANGVTEADLKQARQRAAAAGTSVIVGANIAFSVLRLLVNAIMQDMGSYRDDDDELSVKSIGTTVLAEMGSSIADMVFAGGEIYELILSRLTGDRYYGLNDSAIGEISDLVTTFANGDLTKADTYKKLGFGVARVFGLPAQNVTKYFNAVSAWTKDIKNDEIGKFEGSVNRSKSTNYNRLLKASIAGDEAKWNAVKAELLEDPELDMEELLSGYRSKIGEAYKEGELSYDDATKLLVEYGEKSEEDAYWQMDKWDYSIGNGGSSEDYDKYRELNAALKSGNAADIKAEIKIVDENNATKSTIQSIVTKQVKNLYLDGSINATQAKNLLKNYCSTEKTDYSDADTVYWKMKEWDFYKENGDSDEDFSKYDTFLSSIEKGGSSMKNAANELLNHGTKKGNIANAIAGQYKEQYVALYKTNPTKAAQLLEKILDAYEAIGYTRSERRNYIAKNWFKEKED